MNTLELILIYMIENTSTHPYFIQDILSITYTYLTATLGEQSRFVAFQSIFGHTIIKLSDLPEVRLLPSSPCQVIVHPPH